MLQHTRIRRFGSWVYADGHIFNTQTKQLIDIGDIDNQDIDSDFIKSKMFQQLAESQPIIHYQKAKVHAILALELTNRCNYACPYCFEGNSQNNKDILDFTKACSEIDKLTDGSELRFFGGEPLLQFELIKRLVEKYPQHSYSIVTNGSLITEEIAKFFATHNFSVGLSYDGLNWQEKNRPSPSSNSVQDFKKSISLLLSANVYTGISTVITKESIPYLYDIHLEMFDDYPIQGWAYLIAYTANMTLKDLDIFRNNLLCIIEHFPAEHLLRINDLKKWAMKITGEWPIDA